MMKPKFQIGDIVYNKVERRGSYETSICPKGSCLKVEQISRKGNVFVYTCGYEFEEKELASRSLCL